MTILRDLALRAATFVRREEGAAIGWLIIGILLGIGLVVFAVIKFLIPGE
ncbi:MAG TPA: hypothetical protein VG602_04705 [Actinomycetota bacterium]|nr:hypothetical protein [Actinomycetota bacterium]